MKRERSDATKEVVSQAPTCLERFGRDREMQHSGRSAGIQLQPAHLSQSPHTTRHPELNSCTVAQTLSYIEVFSVESRKIAQPHTSAHFLFVRKRFIHVIRFDKHVFFTFSLSLQVHSALASSGGGGG